MSVQAVYTHPWERVRGTPSREREEMLPGKWPGHKGRGEDAGLGPATRSFICLPRATLVASAAASPLQKTLLEKVHAGISYFIYTSERQEITSNGRESTQEFRYPTANLTMDEVSAQQFLDSCLPFLYYSAQCTQIFETSFSEFPASGFIAIQSHYLLENDL